MCSTLKEFKIVSLEEIKDYVWLSREVWERARTVPPEEYVDALHREDYAHLYCVTF